MNIIRNIVVFMPILLLIGCYEASSNESSESTYSQESDNTFETSTDDIYEVSSDNTHQNYKGNSGSSGIGSTTDETYHENPNYKYEYRTGSSGDYEYNYDVSGTDSEGNDVTGNINITGGDVNSGTGTIEDADGNEIEVDVEWDGYGTLEATDDDGNTYELEAD